MNDLISRQDAIAVTRATVAEGMLADTLELRLNELPSAEKTGKWIKKSNTSPYWTEWWYECSECCHTPLHDRYRQEALTDFCPNCGARMVGEEE